MTNTNCHLSDNSGGPMKSKNRNGTVKSKKNLKLMMQYLIAIFIALLTSVVIIELYHPVLVSGESMEPTFQNGNLLISTTDFSYENISIGDIIVFKEKIQLIKRVVAKENDTISIVGGILFINGEKSPYQFEPIDSAGILVQPYTLHKNELFCMGDNRNHSTDSRDFGPISFKQIKYKVIKKAFQKD